MKTASATAPPKVQLNLAGKLRAILTLNAPRSPPCGGVRSLQSATHFYVNRCRPCGSHRNGCREFGKR
jgi:hypothetical protein